MSAMEKRTLAARGAGILLHVTSLPGPYGIGDLGPAANAWIDTLGRSRQSWWQMLPLGPTGYGDSPYQCFSAVAGNPLLISPDRLTAEGLIAAKDLAGLRFPIDRVDFAKVFEFKTRLTARAWENFRGGAAASLKAAFDEFCGAEKGWLDDFALFMAIKDARGGAAWQEWPDDLRLRKPPALAKARNDLNDSFGLHQFRQFLFARQWESVKAYAHGRGIKLIGDMPIFVASDSADVWANPELFKLDAGRRPRVVAGVPPDYFAATGQLWGNPIYDWDAHRQTGFAWWAARLRATLRQVDLVRLDHFRGFEAAWEVPAGNPTAEHGEWVHAPGAELLASLESQLGGLPVIAEDLGLITPEVDELRDRFGLPGMRVLQFAFGGAPEGRFLPHNYIHNCVVYTGTHDNSTTLGWYVNLIEKEHQFFRRYSPPTDSDVAWDLIRLAWRSVADLAIAPLQDVLGLGDEARMNFPGKPAGNWGWRFTERMLTEDRLQKLADLTEVYQRSPEASGERKPPDAARP